jgi:hypothetical protein
MVASDLPTGISSGQVAEMIASQPPELLRRLLALSVALDSCYQGNHYKKVQSAEGV